MAKITASMMDTPIEELPADQLLSASHIARALRIHHRACKTLTAKADFPPPLHLGPYPQWRAGAVANFLREHTGTTIQCP